MPEPRPTILIIGAARSGTHLLASILESHIDCAYANEVNSIWRIARGTPRHDAIPPDLATDAACKSIRARLDRIRDDKGRTVLMEKTASNCLRLPFVYRVYPDAWYIHIVRDGRDVACSASRKFGGDSRKLTSAVAQTGEPKRRTAMLMSLLKHKVKSGLSLRQVLADPGRYINGALSVLGLRKQAMWGPRFPGMRDVFRRYPPVQVGGIQWKKSIDAIEGFLQVSRPKRYHELRFEELVESPKTVIQGVLDFLGDAIPHDNADQAVADITPPARTWRDTLSEEEVDELQTLIGSTLSRWGYL